MVQVRVRKSKHGGASKEISEDIEPEEFEDEPEEQERPSVSGGFFRKIFGRG
jgi:hypothetical protein